MSCRAARLLCASFLLSSASVYAQDVSSDPPAHISWVEGSAVLERDGQPDAAPANMPLLAGDRVRTSAGRVEILFADGSTLHLDERTTVDFQSDDLVRLLEGRVRLSIPGRGRVRYRIDAPSGAATIEAPGEYRVSILEDRADPEIELAVIRGTAVLSTDAGETPLGAGQRALARGGSAPSYAYAFNSAAWDGFDRWSESRRDQRLGMASPYLPEEVRPYAASFARTGNWRYESSYGYVWYPSVAAAWRPYSNGRWVSLRPYGWTWVGADPWAWPTHHYGRWGISAGSWFWIPGRSWAPAWVSWAYSPGYVSWCPLGWNNRPVVQIVNVYGGGRDHWRAWTAVPERRFAAGYDVRRVMARDTDLRAARPFVERERGPEPRQYAVPRASAPIRIAGTAAGRRATSPVYTNLEPGGSRVGAAPSRTMVGPSRQAPVPARAGERAPVYSREQPTGGVGTGATAVRRGDPGGMTDTRDSSLDVRPRAGAPAAANPPTYDNRIRSGAPASGLPIYQSRERSRTAPSYGSAPAPPSYGAPAANSPRAVPREMPQDRSPGPDPRTSPPAPADVRPSAPGGLPARSPYGPQDDGRRAPEGRAPSAGAEPIGRAVPRGGVDRPSPGPAPGSGPGADRSTPSRGPAPGADRRGPDRPSPGAAAPEGGHSRSGGRGR
ncbi:MAG: DUF6600 domain-containing protein [Acidobacteriota bacterium]